MSYYKVCPYCRAALDPCELCDCRNEEKAAQDATNIQDGRAEHVDHAVSASTITEKGESVK